MPFLSDHHGCQGWKGQMASRIRAFDWSLTSLGPLQDWSHSLRSTVQLMLGSPVPMVMLWGPLGYMIYNDAYAVFAGGRHPYLLGCAVERGWPEVAEFNRGVMDTCLSGGTLTYHNKELVLLRNGVPENVWLDLYYSPVADDDQAPAGVIAIVVETTAHVISEQRRQAAEAAYRAENERVQLALNAGALLGSFVWDIQHDRFSSDERFARTFSYPDGQALDDLPIAIAESRIHPDDLPRIRELVDYSLSHGGSYNAEYRIRRADGSYGWVLACGRCEFDGQGRALRFPGVLIDIQERKLAEDALRQLTRDLEQRVLQEVDARLSAEERLRQAQKLEAIGGLTGGVAHDFNNLLQVISGNLHLLARHEPDNVNVQRRTRAALAAVERGAKLSAQLLAFARRQPLSPAVYDPRHLYEDLGELLQRALGETISLEVQLPEDPWCIHVDRNQLENAVLNLLLNARDAMGGEGTIQIRAENLVLEREQCLDKDIEPGQYLCLTVADSGGGMSAEVLEQAFEPFFTTKSDSHGTGLGLSMVFGFVKQSGGHVEIFSSPEQGTRVRMYFARCAGQEAPVVRQPHSHGAGGQESILVVEDNADVRSAAVEMLRHDGYRVSTAASGDAAMQMLLEGLKVDLIFTDVVMPGLIKSTDLATWAKTQVPPIAVLFTSGHTRDLISPDHLLSPDTYLLSKPYRPEELTAMVRSLLGT